MGFDPPGYSAKPQRRRRAPISLFVIPAKAGIQKNRRVYSAHRYVPPTLISTEQAFSPEPQKAPSSPNKSAVNYLNKTAIFQLFSCRASRFGL
jgi:hypothetical protein